MVVSANADLYTPFPHGMIVEDGPQSSEEGSGLHSPIFGAPFPAPHGDSSSIRYQQLDVQHAAGILATQFDYNVAPPLNVQQPPLLDTTLDSPSPHHQQHISYPSSFSVQPRNQRGIDFSVHSSANSRLHPPSVQEGGQVDFRYNSPSARRLPGGQSHDQTAPRQSGNPSGRTMDGDHRSSNSTADRPELSPTNATTGSRESRKEISTVVIACRQCRGRKIRCDSTRPVCNNCVRRSNECQYDAVPKRRGPDKRPGTRQRSCKKRPADGSVPPPSKRKKTTSDTQSNERALPSKVKENMAHPIRPPSASRIQDVHEQDQGTRPPSSPLEVRLSVQGAQHDVSGTHRQPPFSYQQSPYDKAYPRPLDVNIMRPTEHGMSQHHKFPIPSSPSVEHQQGQWWDTFLHTYSLQKIEDELTYLFTDTGYWLAFLNLQYFIQTLYDPVERLHIQPAFILAGLALASLLQSSQIGHGADGRDTATWLRNAAQAELEAAWNSEWRDATLAEAALILALYEYSAHPEYNPDRIATSLVFLDNIIHSISLTSIDSGDPDVTFFPPRGVPVVELEPAIFSNGEHRKCMCIPPDSPHPPDQSTSWSYPLGWDSSWNAVQIRDEECRRLCWSALNLVASFTSQCAILNKEPPNLYLSDPANWRLLFPGEVMDRMAPSYRSSDSPSPKESVWALYCRSMLLWSFCNRLRRDPCSDEDRAEYSMEAMAEAQSIQDSLDMHICNLDTALMYMCREYIFNTRIEITYILRSLRGLDSGLTANSVPNGKQAFEWLLYQVQVIDRVKSSISHLSETQGHQFTRRPFQVTWFSTQLSICLMLWNHDPTLLGALNLAKSILVVVDVMNALWPCPYHQHQCDELRARLIDACASVNLGGPPSAYDSLPPLLKPS